MIYYLCELRFNGKTMCCLDNEKTAIKSSYGMVMRGEAPLLLPGKVFFRRTVNTLGV